jgi:hypothetical protein
MANSIALFKKYVPILDEVYKAGSLTSILDGAPELAREGANVNELIIPKMTMQGLANYDRNSGYVAGDVTLTNETVTVDYDRGRMFTVDTQDNAETAGIAFGKLAGEFIRTKVVPEVDAYRLAKLAQISGIGTVAGAALSTGDAVIAALRAGLNAMNEAEVPLTDRILFITATLYNLIKDLDNTKSRAVLDDFASVVQVPQTRFYTKITLAANGDGGYSKDGTTGKNINFEIVHKPAVIQFTKHIAPKVITPEANQDADAWKFGYRIVGVNAAYENKVAGIYLHKSTT